MKQLLLTVLFSVTLFFSALTQNCADFYFFQNNKTVNLTLYNSKGEENGKKIYVVSNVQTQGATTSSTVNSELYNGKGKLQAKGVNTMQCTGGVMLMDIRMTLSDQQQKQLANATAKTDNVFIEYPAGMKEGDNLKDASLHMDLTVNNSPETVDMNITNRKVAAKEKITSTAGSWDCFKITYTSKVMIKVMGIGVPVSIDVTEWFCPQFGVIKTETKYGSTLVTSIN